MIGTAGFAAVSIAGTLTHAAFSSGSQLFGPVLIAGRNPDQIALTYDDGPNPNATPELLDLLAEHDVRATFFMIGRFVRAEPALVRRIADAGHAIGNHTMTHPWLAWQTPTRIREELAQCNAALEDTSGSPVQLFRPPHGARRPIVLRIAAELGLIPVHWNIMPKDWQGAPEEVLLTRMTRGLDWNRRLGRGSNLLLHDGSDRSPAAERSATIAATRLLIERHSARLRFVTPHAWIADPADQPQ